MGRKLLIVASKRYGDYVKEIAESMGCFEEISFVDNDREGAIGKLEDVESFYPEYNCVVEPYCLVGDGCTLKSGTIVKSTSMVAMNTSTEQGSVLFTSLTKE